MKKIESEQLDRDLIELNSSDRSIYRAVSAAVADKKITFTSFEHSYSPWYQKHGQEKYAGVEQLPRKIQLEFQKICTHQRDHIEIMVKKFTRLKVTKRCDLGHDHSENEIDFDVWERMTIDWETFEQLIDWFQSGRFYDARTRPAKKNGGPFHSSDRID